MNFVYNDGGRKKAGFKGKAQDCVCRAIAIATEKPYQEVYDEINHLALKERRQRRSGARTGVYKPTIRRYMESLGWSFRATMTIGGGCTVHLRSDERPPGRLVVSVSKHLVAVIDGVILDTHNPSRAGTRCVYGYIYRERNPA